MSDGEIYRDNTYLEANPDWHEGDADWKAGKVAELLERNSVRPSTIADVGCGTGGVLRALAADGVGSAWTGWDISPQAHEIAVANASGGVDFRLGDISETDERFDLVMALDVFEHVDDYLGFLRNLAGRSTHTVFHIPLDMTALSVARSTPMLRNRERIGHIHYFSNDTALATLAEAHVPRLASAASGGSAGFAPTMWAGDQNTDWSRGDGLPRELAIVAVGAISGAGEQPAGL